jgi:photosystem II stability/assembly factor-like uncharacterized protein
MKNLISTIAILILILVETSLSQTDWKQTNGPSGGNVTYLTKDRRGYLYALAANSNVYISKDNGDHWNKILEGIHVMGIDKNNYCYTIEGDSCVTIYDENLNLVKKSINIYYMIYEANKITIDNDGYIYISTRWGPLWMSSDMGDSWKNIYNNSDYDFALDSNKTIILTTASDSVKRSTNKGNDWKTVKLSDTGYAHMVSYITYNKHFGNFIASEMSGIIYISSDGGFTWMINTDTIPIAGIETLYSDDYGNTYLAGYGSIWMSNDGGFKWKKLKEDNMHRNFNSLAANKNYIFIAGNRFDLLRYNLITDIIEEINEGINNQNVFTLTSNSKGYVFAHTGHTLFRTTDGGNTWHKLPFPQRVNESNYSIICTKNNYIFASSDSTVQRSSDDGYTWVTVLSDSIRNNSFSALTESESGRIYLATNSLYYSDDNGDTWIKQYSFTTSITALAIYQDKYIVACSFMQEIFFSDDSGKSFKSLPIGVPEHYGSVSTFDKTGNVFINMNAWMGGDATFFSDDKCQTFKKITQLNYRLNFLKVDSNNNIYTNDKNRGLIFSSDKGTTWKSLNNSLIQDKQIYDMCFVKNGAYLASIGYSVFKTDYLMDVDDPKCISVSDLDISPNPASDFIEISVGANGPSPLQSEVKIYDIYGQNVLSVVAIHELPLQVNVSGLAPGMYFVRIGDRVGKFMKL